MDETIGSKGGHNDRKRTFRITQILKEKLKKKQEDKELKELEKDVKRKQTYTLIKTIPIVIVGQTIKELTSPQEKEKFVVINNEEEIKKEPETKKVTIILKDGTKQIIEVPKEVVIKQEIEKPKVEEKQKEEIKQELKTEPKEVIKEQPVQEQKQDFIPVPKTEEKQEVKENTSKGIEVLNEKQKNKLQKLQARKIIDVYEKQLKDIRYELRNLIIEYNTLVGEEDKVLKSKEEEKILERLNQIIKKIEELKDKIRIEDLDKYDDNYIYTLIEGYLEDFKDKKLIKEIKDSPLYILISEKLDEFDKKKEKFKGQIEEKKENLETDEKELEELKEKYFKIEKINKDLESFYKEQEEILREMQAKIDKAVTVTEKVQVRVEYMNRQSKGLLRNLTAIMLIPGPRGAKALAAMTAIYVGLTRSMLEPKTVTKKYKEITVYDYSKEIEKNIKKIDETSKDLSKTNKDIDSIIKEIKEEFSQYIGVIPECDELLSNLNKVKSNIEEKEYELEKIKDKQEKELERNNNKVLSKGIYPM